MDLATLLDRHGTTYAEEAGVTLRDRPSPLWQLLVLSLLLSARIDARIATASARELFRAGWRTPQRMRDSTWQQRVDALGRGGYRRYDERTATQLAEAADLVTDRWRGDLRRLRDAADGDVDAMASSLREVKGIGPAGASIFLREVQGVWPSVAPYVDDLAARGAERAGLPHTGPGLARHVGSEDLPRLVAACVRVALER
ncbi:endonuclease [Aeromicrobium sp. 50.2.37]|uniref:endonuclease n=1 Tax=Aeromicrobium sp. 50.2.37 TaxID=2969305 RepID=UPI0021501829|nr:endonuclease [Aeromicrobium sp. 50.2.37]MCR4513408.1 endonuclease [Aeromicrobium sp. 50.2.37]